MTPKTPPKTPEQFARYWDEQMKCANTPGEYQYAKQHYHQARQDMKVAEVTFATGEISPDVHPADDNLTLEKLMAAKDVLDRNDRYTSKAAEVLVQQREAAERMNSHFADAMRVNFPPVFIPADAFAKLGAFGEVIVHMDEFGNLTTTTEHPECEVEVRIAERQRECDRETISAMNADEPHVEDQPEETVHEVPASFNPDAQWSARNHMLLTSED